MANISGTQKVTMHRCSILILLAGVLFFSQLTYAQGLANSGSTGRAAQYFLGDKDQVLMAVNVWGFVNVPGQYMVPLETDLVSLLSYAGGPREDARIKRIRVVRTSAQEDSSLVISVDVKNFVTTGDLDENPLLLPGDTVVVSGTTFHLVSKMFELGFRIAMIVQAVYLAQWYSTRD